MKREITASELFALALIIQREGRTIPIDDVPRVLERLCAAGSPVPRLRLVE